MQMKVLPNMRHKCNRCKKEHNNTTEAVQEKKNKTSTNIKMVPKIREAVQVLKICTRVLTEKAEEEGKYFAL